MEAHTLTAITHTSAAISSHLFAIFFSLCSGRIAECVNHCIMRKILQKQCELIAAEVWVIAVRVWAPTPWLPISNPWLREVGAHTRNALTHTSAALSSHLVCNILLIMQWFTHSAILPLHNEKNIAKRCELIEAEVGVTAVRVWALTSSNQESVISAYPLGE